VVDDADLEQLTDEEIQFHMLALRRELDAELADYPDLEEQDPDSTVAYTEIDFDADDEED
jgi:hypothetical protein